jgi:hypothetical protein
MVGSTSNVAVDVKVLVNVNVEDKVIPEPARRLPGAPPLPPDPLCCRSSPQEWTVG